jgi:hypothetical protein
VFKCPRFVPVVSPNCPGTCLYDVPVVSPFSGFARNPSFFEDIFGCDAFSPRSILRTKPTLQSARLVLSHSGNDRYRNIRTQPGFNSLGMSCDNPSRGANPWTTLKRTAKTKSLRFVRLVSPFQPSRKVQSRVRMVTQVSQSWSIQKNSL